MPGVFISNADLVTLVTYAPIGAVLTGGVFFATHTKRRLDKLEAERTEARGYSHEFERKVHEVAEHLSFTEHEIMGIVRGIASQKARGTPISQEDAERAAEIVAQHQAKIEKLLDD